MKLITYSFSLAKHKFMSQAFFQDRLCHVQWSWILNYLKTFWKFLLPISLNYFSAEFILGKLGSFCSHWENWSPFQKCMRWSYFFAKLTISNLKLCPDLKRTSKFVLELLCRWRSSQLFSRSGAFSADSWNNEICWMHNLNLNLEISGHSFLIEIRVEIFSLLNYRWCW